MSQMSIDGIYYELVRRKRMRNLRIAVLQPDGHVRVSAPYGVANSVISDFVASRADWIRARQSEISSLPKREPVDFVSGEPFTLWGRQMALEVVEAGGSRSSFSLDGDILTLAVRAGATMDDRRALFERFMREQLHAALEEIVPQCEALTGLVCASWSIRRMERRWGSCTVQHRTIRFALKLAEYPPECTRMVVIHELGHIAYPNHGPKFKAYMDRYSPDWRQIWKLLS